MITKKIPDSICVRLESPVSTTFRCQMAANSLDIDVKKKSVHELQINNIDLPHNWTIGIIYGASGSGKTTLAKHLFGDNIFQTSINDELPIIDQFPESMQYEDIALLLTSIGLSSVPCWIRPMKTLSNGQRARAEAALLLSHETNNIVVIDEWTSVVDRTVAKAMSFCLQKFARRDKTKKQIIILSCHADIIEWVKPDWLIDCNEQIFKLPASSDFFFQPRERLEFIVRSVNRRTWKRFAKYHYLSDKLPGGKIYCYGLFLNDIQIGFQCFANYTPHRPGTKIIYHSNRTVIHPDYVGFGLGLKLINLTSMHLQKKINCIIMAKYSSIPVFKAMIKDQNNWQFVGEKRLMGKMNVGGNMMRNGGFREKGVKTYHFKFIGK